MWICAGISFTFYKFPLNKHHNICTHIFVKMTRYLHVGGGGTGGFHYAQWLVSNNNILPYGSSWRWHTAKCVVVEKNSNSVSVKRSWNDRPKHEAWTRNSKLIVKAHKTLISWRGWMGQKGFGISVLPVDGAGPEFSMKWILRFRKIVFCFWKKIFLLQSCFLFMWRIHNLRKFTL